jgi:hypothetical protein
VGCGFDIVDDLLGRPLPPVGPVCAAQAERVACKPDLDHGHAVDWWMATLFYCGGTGAMKIEEFRSSVAVGMRTGHSYFGQYFIDHNDNTVYWVAQCFNATAIKNYTRAMEDASTVHYPPGSSPVAKCPKKRTERA